MSKLTIEANIEHKDAILFLAILAKKYGDGTLTLEDAEINALSGECFLNAVVVDDKLTLVFTSKDEVN